MAIELGIDRAVIFAGANKEAASYMSLFDFSVLTSEEEGCPNSVMESLSAGTPVVASAVGGIPELMLNREHGLLVPPNDAAALADAITWMIEHPAERRLMGERAAVRMRREFSADRMVEDTQALYLQLLRKSQQGRMPLQGQSA